MGEIKSIEHNNIIYIIFLYMFQANWALARDYKVTCNYAENLLAEFGGTREKKRQLFDFV